MTATGKGIKALGGRVAKAGLRHVPVVGAALDIAGAMGGGEGKKKRHRRARGMYLRRGRLFMGFSQKEVKDSMRRAYGGRRKARK